MAPRVFRLPDLGEGLTEAALVRWLVAAGDPVAIDQPIAEVETAKSAVELPSPFAGVVARLHGEEGATIPVGAPLLEVEDAETAAHAQHREEELAGSGNVLIGYGTSADAVTGRRRRPLATGPRESVRDAARVAVRSPLVRRLARENGLDLAAIPATGPDGAVTRDDVRRAISSARPAGTAASAELAVATREPLGMLRSTIAAKLSRSRSEIPEATVWVDVDATALWELRRAMTVDGRAPSLTAILARFVVLALERFPVLGGRLVDGELLTFDGVHLGVAADTPRGLLVPVVRRAERRSIADLDAELRRLTEAARAGTSPPAELTGSTFTLNNYGALGVDGSAAIINHPEVAILGIGRMIERPWVVDGAIVPRRVAQLSLVFDHRVCDGGYAAAFLRAVADAIEHPARLFTRL